MAFFKDAFTAPLDLGGKGDPASIVSREAGLRTPGEATADVSGVTAANAIREAQRLQEEFGREALNVQELAQRRLEETLAPFVQFGTGLLPRFEGLFSDPFSDQSIIDLTELANQGILGNQGITPLSGDILSQNAPLVGMDLLSRERGDLLSALGLGQASAAQQAAGQLETGGARQDLLSQLGNVQAAGGIGQAQALGQGAQNIVGGGTALLQAFRR